MVFLNFTSSKTRVSPSRNLVITNYFDGIWGQSEHSYDQDRNYWPVIICIGAQSDKPKVSTTVSGD